MQTPSFLVWALERHCTLRQIAGWQDPERTERLLRAARCYDEARAADRILDGIAVAPEADVASDPALVRAFRVDVALQVYGGASAVNAACCDCPANALRGHFGRQLAGCFGMWPLPQELDAFVARASDRILAAPQIAAALPNVSQTSPAWYGLWLESPLVGKAAALVANVLRQLDIGPAESSAGRDEFVLALDAAAARSIPLHFRLYPPGRVEQQWWHLVPHCDRCQAPWLGSGRCRVCGQTLHPASPTKRHVRGTRPFVPLTRLMPADKAADFIARYRQRRMI